MWYFFYDYFSEIKRLRSLSPDKRKLPLFAGAGGSAGGGAGGSGGGDGAGGVETVDSRPEWPGRATNYELAFWLTWRFTLSLFV